ncbi:MULTISPECIES: hypothetical protein [unclassified Okeania]|nr:MULTISPECIES: hypothetical protein [unclassified Okeania]
MVKRVYDINLNSLGVRSQESELKSQEGRKKKKPRVEGESFFAT